MATTRVRVRITFRFRVRIRVNAAYNAVGEFLFAGGRSC